MSTTKDCLEQSLNDYFFTFKRTGDVFYNGDHVLWTNDWKTITIDYLPLDAYGFSHLVKSFRTNIQTFVLLKTYFISKLKIDITDNYTDYFSNDIQLEQLDEAILNLQSKQGVKELDNKPIMYTVLKKQFPDAIQEVVRMSMIGHEKYKETDADYLNFKRVADPVETYRNAAVRHLLEIGDGDTQSHAASAAWNCLAALQILLEQK